jgi:hypothetical protein
VINATTFMSATGHLKAHASWTFGQNTSSVEAWAQLGLWFGFPSTPSARYENVLLGIIGTYSHWITGPATATLSISAGVNLSETMFPVPPNAVVVFQVAVRVHYWNNSGDIEADFESGNFSIACPVVVFSLLNKIPV